MTNFYKPTPGDTASAVAEGYDQNFRHLEESKADAGQTSAALDDIKATASATASALDAAVAALGTKVDKTEGRDLMTAAERSKLDGIEEGANAYSLPPASASTLGGIKAGNNLTVRADGTLDAPNPSGLDPDSYAAAAQVSPADRLLSFSPSGEPQTATAAQLREYATEQVNTALAGKADAATVEAALDEKFGTAFYVQSIDDLHVSGHFKLRTETVVPGGLPSLGCHLLHLEWDVNAAVQIHYNLHPVETHIRRKLSGVWGSWCKVWHSGNFDPASKASIGYQTVYDGIANIPFTVGLQANNISGKELSSTLTLPGTIEGYATQLRIRDYEGSTEASIRGEQTKQWYGLWHSGNFDPGDYFHLKSEIYSADINSLAVAQSRSGVRNVNYGNQYSGMLVSFDTGHCSSGPLQFLLDRYDNPSLQWRNGLNSAQADGPFRTIYDTGNLGPATASADGLMSAADKQKLDTLSSQRRCCGIIDSNGTFGGAAGVVSVTKQGPGKYMVTHNFNSIKYAVVATPFALWTGNDAADARFVCTIKQRLENHFTVHVFDINRNACVDQAFMFIVMPTE